mmetsp:Transcript_22219/g.36814  ORF Transcript_22219/g.36814 Transcript_22219/m.36814 type:complete len:208 (-) Transcript_22219:127-750(-)|eukprot:CAMPEP_0184659826 /NCGR_PEP_ID=MMETSP0308-20130426/31230_1 /TAXON_ID=38269 /ORGANISM="Gloeochaete witrockiana, Strain SAG 46.84" /LENGTH=207 /DNA_ID=CAMNT_0027099937 /DNA_START=109 /DNA_END=732 /DNA_ORIENTATION=-
MKKEQDNVLLVKTELGKSRKTTYSLPPDPAFTYGKRLPIDFEGAGQVISSWKEHTPNPDAIPGRDFKAINKMAVTSGAVTSHEQADFRQTHDHRLRTCTNHQSAPPLPSDADPAYTYGRTVRPSTPLVRLIQNDFGRSHDSEMEASESQQVPKKKFAITQTRASIGHSVHEPVVDEAAQNLWKMTKFQKTTAKVDTRRTSDKPSLAA